MSGTLLNAEASSKKIGELIAFLKEGITKFHDTGSLCSTTRYAGEALSSPLKLPRKPMKILEVGAGTGSVTSVILDMLVEGDHFVTCEMNDKFLPLLESRVKTHPSHQNQDRTVLVFAGPIQALTEDSKFDVIICALPFLNFSVQLTQEIFLKLARLSTSETVMTYYQYIALHLLGKLVSFPERRNRLKELERFFEVVHQQCFESRMRIWRNVLPINIYSLKMGKLALSQSHTNEIRVSCNENEPS